MIKKTNIEIKRLKDENEALWAQLKNVGLELLEARRQLSAAREVNFSPDAEMYQRREKLVLIPQLMPLLNPHEKIVIVDGGARSFESDPRWKPFPPARLRMYGFEADGREANRLNALDWGELECCFFPAGLWGESGTALFEHNNIGGGSSFLPQHRTITDRWKFENPTTTSLAKDIFFPERREYLPVITLLDWGKAQAISSIDFLKLNVQGAELAILEAAGPLLDTVLGILVEVAFVESYQNRPMFSDVDKYLRERGFMFFDLLAHHYVGRERSPVIAQQLAITESNLGQLVSAWGQLIEGHALYLRDPISVATPKFALPKLLKLVAIAEAYGQVEFAFELLDYLAARPDEFEVEVRTRIQALIREGAVAYSAFIRSRE